MKYNILEVKDHNVKIKLGHNVYYGYSKKKIEKCYPNDNYTVIGEIKRGRNKRKVAELTTGETISKIDTYSRVFNRKKGYLCVGKDTYLLVLRPRWILLLLLFLTGLLLALMLLLPKEPIVVSPDTPLPDVSPIEDDQSIKPEVDEGDGSVTMIWKLEAEANLSDGKVEVYFKNPNASTHDVEVELYVISEGKEILVARSDRVKAGYSLNRMNILDSVRLSEGIYTGFYRIIGYDPETGEQAAYLPQISDVVLTARY